MLQHFGWNSDSHLQQGRDFILRAACLWENVREAAVTQPCSSPGLCTCVTMKLWGCPKWSVTCSRAETRVVLTKADHFGDASQAQGNMMWVVGNPCDAEGACKRVRSWLRCSSRWYYPKWNVTRSLQMVMWSSLGETQELWGLDGNFTTCYRQLMNISKSHGILQFQRCHWWPRALGCFSYGCFMEWHHWLKSYEYTAFWRSVSDFLQSIVTEGDVACTSSCASVGWLTPLRCGSLSRCFTPNLHRWIFTGEPEPSSAPIWPHALWQQISLPEGRTQTLLLIPLTDPVISIWWRRQSVWTDLRQKLL